MKLKRRDESPFVIRIMTKPCGDAIPNLNMSKPREFWIVVPDQGELPKWGMDTLIVRYEPQNVKGQKHIHVREVTPDDEAKDEMLREAFTIINEYAGANPEITSNDRKACVWLNKYDDPEGTTK